jgi:hypothetical protein
LYELFRARIPMRVAPVIASPHSSLVRMLVLLAIVSAEVGTWAADVAPEPPDLAPVKKVSYEGDIVLEPMLPAAEPLPSPMRQDPIVPPASVLGNAAGMPSGRIVDASNIPFDGMVIDEGFEELPFEASSGRWFWNGGWYAGGESLWMGRSINNRRHLAVDINYSNVTYTSFAQPFNVAPGARATIGKSLGRDYLDRDRSVEFVYYGGMNYTGTNGWNSASGNNLFTPLDFTAPGFNAAGLYGTTFNSNFNSGEVNYKLRRRLGRDKVVMSPDGTWTRHAERGWLPAIIVGPRLANVSENFSFTSSRPGTPSADFSGVYAINTNNWLLGLNLGGELISQNEFYYWGLRGRAAPALSFASASQAAAGINTTSTGPGGTLAFASDATKTAAGFVGDLTLFAGWQITPNFSFQAGYDFLWVAGMATATRQFNLDNRAVHPIDAGGQTFYNGVSFGFNGSW